MRTNHESFSPFRFSIRHLRNYIGLDDSFSSEKTINEKNRKQKKRTETKNQKHNHVFHTVCFCDFFFLHTEAHFAIFTFQETQL